jgi:uncharacterized protein YegP (UPF0339 family)
MAGTFVLKTDAQGKYRFNLVAANGQIIAQSQAYKEKESALNGIASVRSNAADAEIDDQT